MSKPVPEMRECPFCGGEARVHSPPSDYAGTYVMCGNCCAKTQRFVKPEAAIAAWNTRTVDQHIERLTASLVELLEPLERASAEMVLHGKAADENAEAAFDRAREALSLIKEGKSHGEG